MSEEQFTTETMADYEGQFDNADPWHIVSKYMEQQTDLPVKIEGIVNGGAIAYIEGLRGFIPASKLSLSYIEDLETYLLKEIKVRVIDIDPAEVNKNILIDTAIIGDVKAVLTILNRRAGCRARKKGPGDSCRKYPLRNSGLSPVLRRIYSLRKRTVWSGTCITDL